MYSTRLKNDYLFFSCSCRETPVAETKVTEKVVEDVEDSPVVASGDDTETTPVVEDAPAPAPVAETTTKEDETPVVESTGAAIEVAENGNGEAEVVEPVEEAGKLLLNGVDIWNCHLNFSFIISEESVKRKVVDDEAPEVAEKRAKTAEVEPVEHSEEEVTA